MYTIKESHLNLATTKNSLQNASYCIIQQYKRGKLVKDKQTFESQCVATVKPHGKVYVGLSINFSSLVLQLILCLAYLNDVIKGDKSGRQAKIISNEASGNFTLVAPLPNITCLRIPSATQVMYCLDILF